MGERLEAVVLGSLDCYANRPRKLSTRTASTSRTRGARGRTLSPPLHAPSLPLINRGRKDHTGFLVLVLVVVGATLPIPRLLFDCVTIGVR